MSKYNKTKISGLFESQYGYGVKVNAEVLQALSTLKEGDYLNVTRVKEETRERIANERGKDLAHTIAAYLEFSAPNTEASAPAPKAAPVKGPAKVSRF